MADELDNLQKCLDLEFGCGEEATAHPLADKARAALAAEADGPAVRRREPASVACEPSDGDLLQMMPEQFRADLGTVSRIAAHGAGPDIKPGLFRVSLNTGALEYARAVLARWGHQPALPAEGEVAELAAWLRMQGEALTPGPSSMLSNQTKNERRAAGMRLILAADLLERQVAPVPVSVGERLPSASHVYFEFVISDADDCTQTGGIAPTYAQALSEGQHYLAQYQQDGPHTLELRRVEVLPPGALPVPAGEVE